MTRPDPMTTQGTVVIKPYSIGDPFIPTLVETPDRKSRFLTLADLDALPTPAPLIDNVIDQGTLAVLYGPWGLGKTFVAIDWAASVATGRPWQGRPTKQAKVLYIAAEGAQGFKKRLSAWQHAWNRTIPGDHFIVYPDAVNLMDRSGVAELLGLVRYDGYEFVVVDTLARCTEGADENTSRDMGMAIGSLDRIRRATGTVLAVHHPRKDGITLRGSSAIEGAADTVYAMRKRDTGFILERTKRKDGRLVDHHHLKLVGAGDSCIVEVDRAHTTDGLKLIASAIGTEGATKSQIRDVLMDGGRSRSAAYRELDALVEGSSLKVSGDLYVVPDVWDDLGRL